MKYSTGAEECLSLSPVSSKTGDFSIISQVQLKLLLLTFSFYDIFDNSIVVLGFFF